MTRRLRIAFPPSGSNDWEVRSANALVAVRFNTEQDVLDYKVRDAGHTEPTFDSTDIGDGTGGSMKMTPQYTDSTQCGTAVVPFTAIPTFTTFYVSMRLKQDAAHAFQPWNAVNGDITASKYFMITNTESSHGAGQSHAIVIQDWRNDCTIAGYHWGGDLSQTTTIAVTSWDRGINSACGSGDELAQFYVDNSIAEQRVPGVSYPLGGTNPDTGAAWSACESFVAQRGANFRRTTSTEWFRGLGDWVQGGFRLLPNQWNTLTVKIDFGQFGVANSNITLFGAKPGQAYNQLTHVSNVRLGGSSSGPINAIWILPYVTDRYGYTGRKVTSRTTNIPGVTIHACGSSTPLGVGTLEYNAATQRFRWASAGDVFGAAVGFSALNNKLFRAVASASSRKSTTLTADAIFPTDTVFVSNATAFPAAGSITVAGHNVEYTGKTTTSFTGCTGGGEYEIPVGSPVRNQISTAYKTFTTTPFQFPALTATTLHVQDTTELQASGQVWVGGSTWIQYTGKTATTLTGCTTSRRVGESGRTVRTENYLIIEISPHLLPTSGVFTDEVTIGKYRKNMQVNYRDLIVSLNPIPAPNA